MKGYGDVEDRFKTLAFEHNEQLKKSGHILTEIEFRKRELPLEQYLARMRLVYYQAARLDVVREEATNQRSPFAQAKSSRYWAALVAPNVVSANVALIGFFLNRTIRRIAYTHPQPYLPFVFGAATALADSSLKDKLIFHYFWGGAKYTAETELVNRESMIPWDGTRPYDKECVICWTLTSMVITAFSIGSLNAFSHVFLHTIDEDSHRKLANMDDYHRRKYWAFWIERVKGQMVTANGRPRISGLNVSLATLIPLTLWQMDRTIQDEEAFRNFAIQNYAMGHEGQTKQYFE